VAGSEGISGSLSRTSIRAATLDAGMKVREPKLAKQKPLRSPAAAMGLCERKP
jgi:hypothetical protein